VYGGPFTDEMRAADEGRLPCESRREGDSVRLQDRGGRGTSVLRPVLRRGDVAATFLDREHPALVP
jgi:hypothetical protein